jgi:hypothetical protein
VLDRLAASQLNHPAAPGSDRTELDFVSDAARWYNAAYAAGHPESADLLDDLIARHDPRRARQGRAPAGHVQARPCDPCPLGGLTEVMQCQLTVASAHIGTCRCCQKELLDHGGILPAIRRHTVRSAQRPPTATAVTATVMTATVVTATPAAEPLL